MREIPLIIDNAIRWGTLRMCETEIMASGTAIIIPAKLADLKLMKDRDFVIETIQCDLCLLGNTKKLRAKDILNPYSSKNPNHDQDITFEFLLSRSDIDEIENKRKGTDVDLRLYINFHLELRPHPSSRVEDKKTSSTDLNLKIFKSQWEDTILPAFGYSQKKANSILFRTWEFLKKNRATIFQFVCRTWDVGKDYFKQ